MPRETELKTVNEKKKTVSKAVKNDESSSDESKELQKKIKTSTKKNTNTNTNKNNSDSEVEEKPAKAKTTKAKANKKDSDFEIEEKPVKAKNTKAKANKKDSDSEVEEKPVKAKTTKAKENKKDSDSEVEEKPAKAKNTKTKAKIESEDEEEKSTKAKNTKTKAKAKAKENSESEDDEKSEPEKKKPKRIRKKKIDPTKPQPGDVDENGYIWTRTKNNLLIKMTQDGVRIRKCRYPECAMEGPENLFVSGENTCKQCHNTMKKEKYGTNKDFREKLKENSKKARVKSARKYTRVHDIHNDTKVCTKCGEEKVYAEFRPARGDCMDCERDHGRNYRRSDIGKEKAKQWVNDNRERMTELQAMNYQANKEEINKKNRLRYKNDVQFKIRVNSKTAINKLIKGICSFDKFADCCSEDYIDYMKFCLKKYKNGMTLKNRGKKWHIDHVFPKKCFDLTDEKQRDLCLNWRNTCPLSSHKNMSKHAVYDLDQIKKHYEVLKKYHEEKDIEFPEEIKKYYKNTIKKLENGDIVNNVVESDPEDDSDFENDDDNDNNNDSDNDSDNNNDSDNDSD